ncbi:MAG: IMS domain-containing protein [Cyanophyceae cyanobacterium]
MRIPLDYYRILGVPIQATAESIEQAYHDRTRQLLHNEYSQQAIASRHQLLEEAYAVLSDSQRRAEHDTQFFSSPAPISPESAAEAVSPQLEIRPECFVGALMILQELGEYELVLRLGQSFLEKLEENSPRQAVSPSDERSEVVLTLALACMQLGKERWQREEYEEAATAERMGQDLLRREQLFPSVQEEIQADLAKLRPYRVIDLLAQNTQQRHQGLRLLTEMLDERQGIDGSGHDGSGLSIDDFLRFIQQLRKHLTVAEQQELFEAESQRPSAVAAYLAVYALIARGFAQSKPVLIVRAQEILRNLSQRQDVYLEQAVCAMLLGQTEEANLALEKSQEEESLYFIRQHSQGAPDLLPGLCQYGERWLQTQVFAHFRDLASQKASLKDYFADEKVQTYLEKLPAEAWRPAQRKSEVAELLAVSHAEASIPEEQLAIASSQASRREEFGGTAAGTLTATVPRTASATLPTIEEAKRLDLGTHRSSSASPAKSRTSAKPRQAFINQIKHLAQSRGRIRRFFHPKYILVLGAVGLGLATIGVVYAIFKPNEATVEELQVQLNRSPIAIPPLETSPAASRPVPLDRQSAQQVIENWLAAKSAAFGPAYQVETISAVLAEPLLSLWRNRARSFQQSNAYRKYQHRVEVRSVEIDPQNSDRATVEAVVREAAQHFQGEQLVDSESYDDNLQVHYDLIRQEGQWLIQNIQIL